MQKYYIDLCSSPSLVPANDGDLCYSADAEAEIARLKAELELHKAALRWLHKQVPKNAAGQLVNFLEYKTVDPPPEYAPLIAEALHAVREV